MVILTNENYKDEVLNYKGKVVIDFWAAWCGPCKMAKPMFEAKEKEIDNVKFCEANIDEATDFTNEMKISKGIDNSNDISEKYPDVLSNLVLSVNKCFQYASDGKNAISEAITGADERVIIPDEATFEQLAECIGKIFNGFKL